MAGAGADVAGADGAQQSFNSIERLVDQAARFRRPRTGSCVAEKSFVGGVDAPREHRSSHKEAPPGLAAMLRRRRHETRTLPVCKYPRCAAHQAAPKLAEHRARFGHLGELDIPLENADRAAFQNQKPPGLRALGEHGLAPAP